MKIPATKKEALELVSQLYKENSMLEEVVEGARLYEEMLLEYIREICYLIYFRQPDEELDKFVTKMIDVELYHEAE
mgnify:CR=1 FL=1|tara:strand:- start:354 stop:581 length:228 start_codon:yes stop_codon:yes gene_type:complete